MRICETCGLCNCSIHCEEHTSETNTSTCNSYKTTNLNSMLSNNNVDQRQKHIFSQSRENKNIYLLTIRFKHT